MTAFAGAQQTTDESNPCALPELSMVSSVNPSTATVGDAVNFTYSVTNPGTVALSQVLIGSALPVGVNLVSATSSGSVDQDTGYVVWTLDSGLAAGATTQLSVSATVADPGQWDNDACTAGQDAIGNQVKDCSRATLFVGVPTATPTATVTPTATATTTATVTVTPTSTVTVTPTSSVSATVSPTAGTATPTVNASLTPSAVPDPEPKQ